MGARHRSFDCVVCSILINSDYTVGSLLLRSASDVVTAIRLRRPSDEGGGRRFRMYIERWATHLKSVDIEVSQSSFKHPYLP